MVLMNVKGWTAMFARTRRHLGPQDECLGPDAAVGADYCTGAPGGGNRGCTVRLRNFHPVSVRAYWSS